MYRFTKEIPITDNNSVSKDRDYIFCTIAVLLCVRHVLQILHFSVIASVLFKLLYIAVFAFLLYTFFKKFKARQPLLQVLFFIVCLVGIAWVLVQLLTKYPEYLQSSATFLLATPLLFSCDSINISRKDSLLFFKLLTVVALVLAFSIFIPSNYKNGELLLYTLNGNQSGLLYMSVFTGIFTYRQLERKRLLVTVLLAFLLYGCWLSASRASFLVCLFCILSSVLFKKAPSFRDKFLKIAFLLVILVPLFSAALVNLVGENFEILGGSLFTGRDRLWSQVIEGLKKDPFGMNIYTVVTSDNGRRLGAHNVLLDVAWKYSLPIGMIFFSSIIYMSKQIQKKLTSRDSAVVIACFISGLIHMTYEASIISGALDYTLYFLLSIFCGIGLLNKD